MSVPEEEVSTEEEQNEQELLAREVFDSCVAGDKSEDEIKIALVQDGGVSFSAATRMYNQFMVDAGFAMSKEDRDKIIQEVCSGQDLSGEEVFNGCVGDVTSKVEGATERQAGTWVRAWAKKSDQDCYTKPKGTGARTSGFRYSYYVFLKANPKATTEEAIAFITKEGTENDKRNHPHYLAILDLVNAVAA